MADVLSQSEIDQLLSALNEGSLDSVEVITEPLEKVREYDFRTANRFSKEQIRTLHVVYDNFARLLATYLSGTLRTVSEVAVLSVEEQKYQEFTNSLPETVVLGIHGMDPLTGSTLLEISPDLAFMMISRLLGGGNAQYTDIRPFTDIELVILERMIRQFIPLMNEAWQKVATIKATLERIETSPQFAQIVAMNETIVIITLNVKIGDGDGLLNICIPHLSIQPINQKLNTKVWLQNNLNEQKRLSEADNIRSKIRTTPLELRAVFDDTKTTVYDILNLQIGDVIRLDHRMDNDLTVKVGHLPKFKAALGVKDKKYAVKITDIIKEEETEHE